MGKRRFNDISCVALISSAMCKCVCLFQGAGAVAQGTKGSKRTFGTFFGPQLQWDNCGTRWGTSDFYCFSIVLHLGWQPNQNASRNLMTIIIEMPWLRKDINLLGFKCKSNNMTIGPYSPGNFIRNIVDSSKINFGPAASTIWRSLQWGLGAESTECIAAWSSTTCMIPPTLHCTVLKESLSCTKNPSLAPKIGKFSCKKNSRIIQAFELGENLPKIPLKLILIEPSFRKDGLRVVWSRKAFMELFRWDRKGLQKLLNGNGTDHEAWQKHAKTVWNLNMKLLSMLWLLLLQCQRCEHQRKLLLNWVWMHQRLSGANLTTDCIMQMTKRCTGRSCVINL